MKEYAPYLWFVVFVMIFIAFALGASSQAHPQKTYFLFPMEPFVNGQCKESTIIQDGIARSSWDWRTKNLYVSSWIDGPRTCEEFKAMFKEIEK